MLSRQAIWTYVSVTTVAVLIWLWAAGATRAQQVFPAQLQFTLAGDAAVRWIVLPDRQAVRIELEGSRWSLQRAAELLRSPLTIDLIPEVGPQVKNLHAELNRHERLREIGVIVNGCDPPTLDVHVDRRERVTVPVRVNLSGAQTVGELEVEPTEVSVSLPSLDRARLGQFTAEAILPPAQLRDLAPGVRHTLAISLRLPESVTSRDVAIDPGSVKVSFTIRSRIEQTTLDTVRIQVASAHQDFDEYSIALDDTLRDVTVSGDVDLIRRISSGETRVIALLQLTTNEKERGIQSKRISGFMAINRDGSIAVVNGRVAGQTDVPEVPLRIIKRTPTPAPSPAGEPSAAPATP